MWKLCNDCKIIAVLIAKLCNGNKISAQILFSKLMTFYYNEPIITCTSYCERPMADNNIREPMHIGPEVSSIQPES